jgi:hypothetical protein
MNKQQLFTETARTIIAKFLADKPNKQVIVCEGGFLDQTEGVPVSDQEVIRWVEDCGIALSQLFLTNKTRKKKTP